MMDDFYFVLAFSMLKISLYCTEINAETWGFKSGFIMRCSRDMSFHAFIDISAELQFLNWIQTRLFCSSPREPKAFKVIAPNFHCCDYWYFGIWIDILVQYLMPTYSWHPRAESTPSKIRTVGFEINDTRRCQGSVHCDMFCYPDLRFELIFSLQKKLPVKTSNMCV